MFRYGFHIVRHDLYRVYMRSIWFEKGLKRVVIWFLRGLSIASGDRPDIVRISWESFLQGCSIVTTSLLHGDKPFQVALHVSLRPRFNKRNPFYTGTAPGTGPVLFPKWFPLMLRCLCVRARK